MGKRLYLTTMALFLALVAFAQVRDISVMGGMSVPMYKDMGSDAVLSVNYGHFSRNGLGFRIGVQWSPSVADIDNPIGVPVAFAYRTGGRSFRERLQSGAVGSVGAMAYESPYHDAGDMARDMAGGFLVNLFSDMEFFIGVTPGYVSGSSSSHARGMWGDSWQYWEETWTEKRSDFSISIDAGMCLNYSIWRFDIKLMPAFHYNLTSNYVYRRTSGEEGAVLSETEMPLRWLFTLSGGLAYRFGY